MHNTIPTLRKKQEQKKHRMNTHAHRHACRLEYRPYSTWKLWMCNNIELNMRRNYFMWKSWYFFFASIDAEFAHIPASIRIFDRRIERSVFCNRSNHSNWQKKKSQNKINYAVSVANRVPPFLLFLTLSVCARWKKFLHFVFIDVYCLFFSLWFIFKRWIYFIFEFDLLQLVLIVALDMFIFWISFSFHFVALINHFHSNSICKMNGWSK